MADRAITWRDLDSLRRQIRDLAARVERLDREGTRALSERVSRLAHDMSELSQEMTRHERRHERELELRRSRTRWLVTVLIAGLAAIEAPLAYLVAHIHLRDTPACT